MGMVKSSILLEARFMKTILEKNINIIIYRCANISSVPSKILVKKIIKICLILLLLKEKVRKPLRAFCISISCSSCKLDNF